MPLDQIRAKNKLNLAQKKWVFGRIRLQSNLMVQNQKTLAKRKKVELLRQKTKLLKALKGLNLKMREAQKSQKPKFRQKATSTLNHFLYFTQGAISSRFFKKR